MTGREIAIFGLVSTVSISVCLFIVLGMLILLLYIFSKKVQNEWIVAIALFFFTFIFYIVISWTVGYVRMLTDIPLFFWEWSVTHHG